MNDHIDLATVAGQVFVDGVINNLPDQVMESPGIGATDVHSRSFSYSFETFEGCNITRIVVALLRRLIRLAHSLQKYEKRVVKPSFSHAANWTMSRRLAVSKVRWFSETI